MQNIINKRGVSEVVTSVFLILLAIGAVSMASVFIYKVVKSPNMSPEIDCLSMQTKQSFDIKKVCYNNSNKEVIAVVKRAFDEVSMDAIDFVFSGEGNSNSWRCGGGCGLCKLLNSGETKSYYFDFSGLDKPAEIELRAGSCGFGKVKVSEC